MMKEKDIQTTLNEKASELSEKVFNNAPVVIIVAGSQRAEIPACMTGRANLGEGREERLRDLLGILETAKQIETRKHFTRP
jgi:hypothetical protein